MTPQKAAGRVVEPPVWVPSAKGTWKSATAAAEPLHEPPGGWPGLCGGGGAVGGQVDGVDDVLDPDGNAALPPLAAGAIYRARLDKRRFGIEPGPGLDVCAGSSLL